MDTTRDIHRIIKDFRSMNSMLDFLGHKPKTFSELLGIVTCTQALHEEWTRLPEGTRNTIAQSIQTPG